MGPFMDPLFFFMFFFGGSVEALQKPAEPNDMDEFMGDDVKNQGIKIDVRVLRGNRKDGLILKAYFIIVVRGGSQGDVLEFGFISDDLSKGAGHDFIVGQLRPCLYIIAQAAPLHGGEFIIIADQLLGQGDRIVDHPNLFMGKAIRI